MTLEQFSAEALDQRFLAVLSGADPLGLAINGMLHIERRLVRFIENRVPAPTAIESTRFGFGQRVDLAIALGLPAEYRPALKQVSETRNQFAHRVDAAINKSDADKLLSLLPARVQKSVPGWYDKIKRPDQPPTLQGMRPEIRYAFLLLVIHATIEAADIAIPKRQPGPSPEL